MMTPEKRMGALADAQTNHNSIIKLPAYFSSCVEISSTKFYRMLNRTLLGAALGILAHNFVVVAAALIVRAAS